MSWLQANWVTVVAPCVVAIIDLMMSINPNLKANSILHQVYLWCGGKPPAAS